MLFNLVENARLVEALTPQAGGSLTGDYVSLKHARTAFVVVHINQAAVDTVAITIEQATAVAGTSSKAITTAVPIWANEDCAAADAFTRQTDAVSFTTSAAQKHKVVVIQVDPLTLDKANGFDCITVKTGASNAANITSAVYVLTDIRYPSDSPPSAITD